jgi:hypothetical protein
MTPVLAALAAAATKINKDMTLAKKKGLPFDREEWGQILEKIGIAEAWCAENQKIIDTMAALKAAHAPGMTDLMPPPENIDKFHETNPPPDYCIVNAAEYDAMQRRLALLDDPMVVHLRMKWKPNEQNQDFLLGGLPVAYVKKLTSLWYAIPEGRWPLVYTIPCENRDVAMSTLEKTVRNLGVKTDG